MLNIRPRRTEILKASAGGGERVQQPHLAQWMNELPEDVRKLVSQEWTPSWMMLSSPFRGGREDRSFAAFRQPNLHAWVTLEEPG